METKNRRWFTYGVLEFYPLHGYNWSRLWRNRRTKFAYRSMLPLLGCRLGGPGCNSRWKLRPCGPRISPCEESYPVFPDPRRQAVEFVSLLGLRISSLDANIRDDWPVRGMREYLKETMHQDQGLALFQRSRRRCSSGPKQAGSEQSMAGRRRERVLGRRPMTWSF